MGISDKSSIIILWHKLVKSLVNRTDEVPISNNSGFCKAYQYISAETILSFCNNDSSIYENAITEIYFQFRKWGDI